MAISITLSGIALGAGFGFVLQRGRFCLNTAFRDIVYIKNYTIFRSYLLALVIATVGANLLEQFGVVSLDQGRQELTWLANILGGYLFGVGMVLAGGCASGTLYRTGEGLVGSWLAALGFMIGASAAKSGLLSGAYEYVRSFVLSPGSALTIHGTLGMNRWVVVVIISAVCLSVVFMGRETYTPFRLEYHWRTTGVLVGVILVSSWYISAATTGTPVGISFPAPSEGLLASVTAKRPWDWGVALLAGVPIGAYISARGLREFSWRAPRADVMVQQFSGGLIMGAGGMLAGGCLIGHGLTGLSALSLTSLLTTACIVLGCWSAVYLLFMRNPSSG